jgi:hypothetical protein
MHGSWLLGYLSALNLWGVIGERKDALKNTDAAAVYLWMDNYCRANPLQILATAAGILARITSARPMIAPRRPAMAAFAKSWRRE